MVGQMAMSGIQKWRQRKIERNTVVLKFREGTEEYEWLVRWLAKQPRIESESSGRQFHVKHLNSSRRYGAPCGITADSGDTTPTDDSSKWALIPENLQGFRFEELVISIAKDEPVKSEERGFLARSVSLSVITRDMGAVDRLLIAIWDAGNEHAEEVRIPRVLALNTWGDWTEVRKAPSNRIPVLPKGVLESLGHDVNWFLKNEDWYHSVGVPYRRGFLLHGIPGSGKTTTAISLASQFSKDIYLLPMDGLSDEKMLQAMRSAGRDAVLLIEDIDCATVTNDRDRTQQVATTSDQPTLQGLLNAIDGVATPEGRILIATTNRRNVIDEALIRPGRFDREFEFTHADYHQVLELCKRFGLGGESESVADKWHAENLSMAEVQKRLIERCGIGNQ